MVFIFRDEDPDPVGSVDFRPAGSGSILFSLDPTYNNGFIK